MAESPLEARLGRHFVLPLLAATAGITALMIGMLWLIPEPERAASSDGMPSMSSTPKRARPTEALYQELCSLCHGKTGAGDGPTELERPARSFVAGGYGYGNTLATVMRTLEFGIPGTAMPAFGDTLSLQERTALAGYVLGMGPKPRAVSPTAGNLAASGRPTCVQGAMQDPSTGEIEPRSLLVGFPNGVAAQYRTEDLAVVAIYSGESGDPFATRTDWRGQGGTPLRPVAQRVWSMPSAEEEPGFAAALYTTSEGRPLSRRLRSTRLSKSEVTLGFDLVDDSGAKLGAGTETVRILGSGLLTRTLKVDSAEGAVAPIEAQGPEVPVDARATAHRIGPGLLLVAPTEGKERHLIYADGWASSMKSVL